MAHSWVGQTSCNGMETTSCCSRSPNSRGWPPSCGTAVRVIDRIARYKSSLLEGFVAANFAFLVLDVFLAHSVNSFRHAAEWIPFCFLGRGGIATRWCVTEEGMGNSRIVRAPYRTRCRIRFRRTRSRGRRISPAEPVLLAMDHPQPGLHRAIRRAAGVLRARPLADSQQDGAGREG